MKNNKPQTVDDLLEDKSNWADFTNEDSDAILFSKSALKQALQELILSWLPEELPPDTDIIGCPECGGWQSYNLALEEMKQRIIEGFKK